MSFALDWGFRGITIQDCLLAMQVAQSYGNVVNLEKLIANLLVFIM
jgi:hypothetical protein